MSNYQIEINLVKGLSEIPEYVRDIKREYLMDFIFDQYESIFISDYIKFFEIFLPNSRFLIIYINEKDKVIKFFTNDNNLVNKIRTFSKKYNIYEILYFLAEEIADIYINEVMKIREKVDEIKEKILKGILISDRAIFNYFKIISFITKRVLMFRKIVNIYLFTTKESKSFLHLISGDINYILSELNNLKSELYIVMELKQSILQQKVEELMRRLTILSTIFLPATLIASIYGMNFEKVYPDWNSNWGFIFSLFLMFLLTIITYGFIKYFERRL